MVERNILLISTGNHCRSKIAQAYIEHFSYGIFAVRTAGVDTRAPTPFAARVMEEVGLCLSNAPSIRLNPEMIEWADVVVTLSRSADRNCPTLPHSTLRFHLPVADPAEFRGSAEQVMDAYRQLRADIQDQMIWLVDMLRLQQADVS